MSRRALRALVVLSAALGTLGLAGIAGAEQAVLPATPELPWTDPAHQSPTEVYASGIASRIAGRPVRVQCHSAGEWAALGFDPSSLGVVRYLYSTYTYRIVAVEDIAHLNEAVCLGLKTFGEASTKPTRCPTTQTATRTVFETVRVKKKVRYWATVRVNGMRKRVRKSKYVWVTKRVPRTVTEVVPGPSAPCYGSGQALPATYRLHAVSLHVLGHESVHLFDFFVGAPVQTIESAEGRAECFGMQFIPGIAGLFGADEDDARALASYYWDQEYPRMQGTPYWRPDCQPGSPFDLTPTDGFWPRRAGGVRPDPGPFVWRTVEDRLHSPALD